VLGSGMGARGIVYRVWGYRVRMHGLGARFNAPSEDFHISQRSSTVI